MLFSFHLQTMLALTNFSRSEYSAVALMQMSRAEMLVEQVMQFALLFRRFADLALGTESAAGRNALRDSVTSK
jgi:hypothetical protein